MGGVEERHEALEDGLARGCGVGALGFAFHAVSMATVAAECRDMAMAGRMV
jgi:hypothetical protein